jgi:hypothetical protein
MAPDCVKNQFFENAVAQNQWFAKPVCSKNGVLTQSGAAPDCLQRPLRSCFRQQVSFGVDMIDIANGCVKRTYKSDFWRNRCVNHHYFLICTQGKS